MLGKNETTEKKRISIFFLTILVIVGLVLLGFLALNVMRLVGRKTLRAPVVNSEAPMNLDITEVTEDMDDDRVLYNGHYYRFNEDLVTILIMGIDTESVEEIGGESWSVDEGSQYGGGQADALFLLLLNPHTKKTDIIAINRNSMVVLDRFDEDGNYKGVSYGQVCLQHGYGDGGVKSCERQVNTVSRMFHNIPINAYAAISMDAIPELNDAVGGVTLTVPDEIVYPEYDMDMHEGDVVTLSGLQAYWFLRLRYEYLDGSSNLRLERQKLYVSKFIEKAKEQSVADVRVAVNLYNTVKKYMVTDIGLDSFTYIATEVSGYDFDPDNIYSLEGETVIGDKYEEFNYDDAALQELIMNLFYEPAD